MYMTKSRSGFNTLEEMLFPSLFLKLNLSSIAENQHSNGIFSTQHMYTCIGLYLDGVYQNTKDQFSFIKNLKNNDFGPNKYTHLFLLLNDDYTPLLNDQAAAALSQEYCELVKIVQLKLNFSMNIFVDYWDKVALSSTDNDIVSQLNLVRCISDKYLTSIQYQNLMKIYDDASNTQYSISINSFSKKNLNKPLFRQQLKSMITKLFDVFESKSFSSHFDFDTFKTDIDHVKSVILSLVHKNPLLLNFSNEHKILALKHINGVNNIDELINDMVILGKYYPSNDSYYSVTFFSDCSVLVQDKEDSLFELLYDQKEISKLTNDFYVSFLKYKTKKSPTVSKYFVKNYLTLFNHLLSKENNYLRELLVGLIRILDNYYENEQVLKLKGFNILEVFKHHQDAEIAEYATEVHCDGLEEYTNDIIYSLVNTHEVDKYSRSVFSNKYMHLYSESLLPLFSELYRLNVTTGYLQNMIGTKMAAFKNSEDLYHAIENVLNLVNNFSYELIHKEIINLDAELISYVDNKLLVRIKNFEQSKKLGSSSWCISRESQYFDQYIGNNREQYFLYDFNKKSTDNSCLIGCTLTTYAKLAYCHLKNDQQIFEDEAIEYIIKTVKNYKKSALLSFDFLRKINNVAYKLITNLCKS